MAENVKSPNHLENMGKTITLRGVARDAKGYAVLVLPTNEPIYIENLFSWPVEVLGKFVAVTGILRVKKLIPDPYFSPDGGISQGAMGKQTILENAKWELV